MSGPAPGSHGRKSPTRLDMRAQQGHPEPTLEQACGPSQVSQHILLPRAQHRGRRPQVGPPWPARCTGVWFSLCPWSKHKGTTCSTHFTLRRGHRNAKKDKIP